MRPKWPFWKHRAPKMRLVEAQCAYRKHCYRQLPRNPTWESSHFWGLTNHCYGVDTGIDYNSLGRAPPPLELFFPGISLQRVLNNMPELAGNYFKYSLLPKCLSKYPLSQNDYIQEKLFSNYFQGLYGKILSEPQGLLHNKISGELFFVSCKSLFSL